MRKIMLLILLIGLVPLINAESYTFKQNENVNFQFVCLDTTNNYCSNTTQVLLTLTYSSNGTILIANSSMSANPTYFNHTLKTNLTGKYYVLIISPTYVNTSTEFTYNVNPAGVEATLQRTNATSRSIYFLFGIAIIFFIGAYFLQIAPPYRLSLFLIGAIFILICVNVIFVSLTDEIVNPKLESLFSTITVISFYMFWFVAALIFVLWIFTFFVTVFDKKKLKQEQSFGGIYGKYD